MRILARSIDVGITQDRIVQTLPLTKTLQVFFHRELAARVRTHRNRRRRHGRSNSLRHFSVDRTTGAGEHELLHLVLNTGLHDVQGTENVDGRVLLRFADADCDARLSRLMTYGLGTKGSKCFHHRRTILNVHLEEFSCGWNILASTAAEVVQYRHLPSGRQRTFCNVTSNKSGAASYQQTHLKVSSVRQH